MILFSLVFIFTLFLFAQVYSFIEFIKAADSHEYEYSSLTKNVKCLNKLIIPRKSSIIKIRGKCKFLGSDYEY